MNFSRNKICTNCVMDESDPKIIFDDKEICNHCYSARKMLSDIKPQQNKGARAILAEEIKKSGSRKKYDCLIGLSGGIDSSMALHLLVKLGLRPLCFSVDNGWNTAESDENILRMVEGLKVPFYRYTIDLDAFRSLQIAFIKSGTPNIEIPTDHILMAASYEMAAKNGIKYIISGGNVATESIMPESWGYNARDLQFIKSVARSSGSKVRGLPLCSLSRYLWMRFFKRIKVVNLLDYYHYDREEAKKILNEKYGWKDYGEKHNENVFTQWFQMYYLPKKFGYDKRKPHFSSLINSGQMTRAEALNKLKERQVYPEIISIDFMKIPKRSHRDYPNSEFWWNLLTKLYARFKRL